MSPRVTTRHHTSPQAFTYFGLAHANVSLGLALVGYLLGQARVTMTPR